MQVVPTTHNLLYFIVSQFIFGILNKGNTRKKQKLGAFQFKGTFLRVCVGEHTRDLFKYSTVGLQCCVKFIRRTGHRRIGALLIECALRLHDFPTSILTHRCHILLYYFFLYIHLSKLEGMQTKCIDSAKVQLPTNESSAEKQHTLRGDCVK